VSRRLVLCCLLAAACGGGSTPAPSARADITALETRAALSGCAASPQPLTVAAANCTSGTESLTLATFTTDGQRDLWTGASAGVSGSYVVLGDGWAATTLDADTANRLAAALGGTLRS
jgi:hypothetical protein